jgi:hypothetical protein
MVQVRWRLVVYAEGGADAREAVVRTLLAVSSHRRSPEFLSGLKNSVANRDGIDSFGGSNEAARIAPSQPDNGGSAVLGINNGRHL